MSAGVMRFRYKFLKVPYLYVLFYFKCTCAINFQNLWLRTDPNEGDIF
jgi:hypothetical protein